MVSEADGVLRIVCRSGFPGRPERIVAWPSSATTALDALRAGSQPIGSSCGGDLVCGRCVVRVLEGALTPPDEREQRVLERVRAEPDERLACRILRDEVVERGALEITLTTNYW